MRIQVMDKRFAIPGLGAVVKRNVNKPRSSKISVSKVVKAWHKEKKEPGILQFFQNCYDYFGKTTEERRLKQYAEGIFLSFKLLKNKVNEESLQQMSEQVLEVRQKSSKYDELYKSIFEITDETSPEHVRQKKEELQQAEHWLKSQKFTLKQIAKLCEDFPALQQMNQKVQKFANLYEKENRLTTLDGTGQFAAKTLYGFPFDQNRLGKHEDKFVPGFENFYIAGSEIKMPYRTYDIMQAPLLASAKKEDTVKDFWDTVVVMRKSPIIVTTHCPKEKLARHGTQERAEYWTDDLFPMELRDGWQLVRVGMDEVLGTSKHSADIRLVKRSFIAKNSTTSQEHAVTQFHIQGWPDHHGAPDHELLEKAHQEIDKTLKERNISHESSITAHCAAGMGRSPLFAVANHIRLEILSRLDKGEKIDEIALEIPRTIYGFKIQRPSLMTGDEQWLSLFLSIRRVFLQIKGIPNKEIRPLEMKLEKDILKL